MTHFLAANATDRWEVVLSLLAAIVVLLGVLIKILTPVIKVCKEFIESVERNTTALDNLSQRVTALEENRHGN